LPISLEQLAVDSMVAGSVRQIGGQRAAVRKAGSLQGSVVWAPNLISICL